MKMYINAQTVITAAALMGAVATLLGGLSAVHSWYQRQNRQDVDIKAMKEEMCLLTYGVLACLKGLQEMNCNGPVTEAVNKIEKHINQEAHK
jgi:hypothetical protein